MSFLKKLNMKAYKVSSIEFKNNLEPNTKLELKNQYSHNVKYARNNICEGILKVDITDGAGNENFRISVTVQGLFAYEGETDKERIHIETFRELFPFARALVTNLTANAGMPPIIIPSIDLDNQEIYKIDIKPKGMEN